MATSKDAGPSSVEAANSPATVTTSIAPNEAASSTRDSIKLRRRSMLPAGTIDPLIRNPTFADTLLILTALDDHLASGFSTTYPEQISNYCSKAVWTDFINDVNAAAKLKLKDKLVIRLRPMLSLIKGMGRAIDSQLGKRTKPILDVLHYWQDILRTYGMQIELRKGGVAIKKKPINPPPKLGKKKKKLLSSKTESNSSDSLGHSSNNSLDDGRSRPGSMTSMPSPVIRPPFLQRSGSEVSVASVRSFPYETADPSLAGKWELVVFTGFKRRSQAASLYSVNRRSTYSLHQTSNASRPATVCMVGTEEMPSLSRPHTPRNRRSMSSSMSSSVKRRSRAKILTLEELANLPLPTPSSPFAPSSKPTAPIPEGTHSPASEERDTNFTKMAHRHRRSSSATSAIQWSHTTDVQQASARARHDSLILPPKEPPSEGAGSIGKEESSLANHQMRSAGLVSMMTSPDLSSAEIPSKTYSRALEGHDTNEVNQLQTDPVLTRATSIEIKVTPAENDTSTTSSEVVTVDSEKGPRSVSPELVQTFVRESSLSSTIVGPGSTAQGSNNTLTRSPLSSMSHTPETIDCESRKKVNKAVRRSSSFVNLVNAASSRLSKPFSNLVFPKGDSARATLMEHSEEKGSISTNIVASVRTKSEPFGVKYVPVLPVSSSEKEDNGTLPSGKPINSDILPVACDQAITRRGKTADCLINADFPSG